MARQPLLVITAVLHQVLRASCDREDVAAGQVWSAVVNVSVVRVVIMGDTEDTLRDLALHDEQVISSILATGSTAVGMSCIDARTRALVRLGALIAVGAPVVAYQSCVTAALAAGANADDVVDTLVTVAPIAGEVRVVDAAPALALAIGYDIDAALGAYGHRSSVEPR